MFHRRTLHVQCGFHSSRALEQVVQNSPCERSVSVSTTARLSRQSYSRTNLARCHLTHTLGMAMRTGWHRFLSPTPLGPEQRLGVAVQVVDAALALRAARAQLEAHGTVQHPLVEQGEVHLAHVLEAVLHALGEVCREGDHVAPLDHGPAHARREDSRQHRVVTVDGVHTREAVVVLQALAVVEEELTRRLVHAGEERPHHHDARPHGERLDGRARAAHATVGDDWHAVRERHPFAPVHGAQLRAPRGLDLLRQGDRTGTHTDADGVRAGLEEAPRLVLRRHVAGDDVDLRVLPLEVAQHLDLPRAVAVALVEHDDVGARRNERVRTPPLRLDGHNRRAHEQLSVALRRVGVVPVLHEVRARRERHDVPGIVHDGQVLDLLRLERCVGLVEGDRVPQREDLINGQHDAPQLRAAVALKVAVLLEHDAQELAVRRAALCDEHAGVAGGVHVLQRGVRAQRLRVADKTVLVGLDAAHHLHLLLLGAVAVQEPDAARERQRDGHLILRHRVHRARAKRQFQVDALRQLRGQVHILAGKVDAAREHDEVLEGDAVRRGALEDLLRGEAILEIGLGERHAVHRRHLGGHGADTITIQRPGCCFCGAQRRTRASSGCGCRFDRSPPKVGGSGWGSCGGSRWMGEL
mmetsp:Transcript_31524/g.100026  ORF Transcript_31524/g.100026 Transcript_31524/m.100026 type:complete len:639 (+) Transcript_31524:1060-2976(+)